MINQLYTWISAVFALLSHFVVEFDVGDTSYRVSWLVIIGAGLAIAIFSTAFWKGVRV